MNRLERRVSVPDLVGLEVDRARDVGHEAAVVVVAADVDGPPLGSLTWPGVWRVTAQDPGAGSHVAKWENVRVACKRADGDEVGDREPRLPTPDPEGATAHATPDDGEPSVLRTDPADSERLRDSHVGG